MNQFEEVVEQTLVREFLMPGGTRQKAIASIAEAHNAEVVAVLEGLKPTAYPDPQGGEAEWEMWADHYMERLSEAIKKHGGGNE